MTRPEFDNAIEKICAAFVFPTPEEATLEAWHQVAGNMPLRAGSWVVAEYIRRTGRITRGVNLGHELNELYQEFKKNEQAEGFRRQRESAAKAECCPDCSAAFPGWIRVHVRKHGTDGEYTQLFRCACNRDPRFLRFPAWTRDQLANFAHMEVLP